jgi:hypothetical protein
LEFAVGDEVLLKVSPTKGIVRFGIKGKLSPIYIGPYLITARVGSLPYRLQLPESMDGVHPIFHISMLRKYIRDPELKIEVDPIIIQQDLTIDAQPVRVLEFSEHVMCNRTIKYVKILWSNQMKREATWELESIMRNKYPDLFQTGKFFVVHISPIFLGPCRKTGRIRGRILFRGENVTPKKILERGSGVD